MKYNLKTTDEYEEIIVEYGTCDNRRFNVRNLSYLLPSNEDKRISMSLNVIEYKNGILYLKSKEEKDYYQNTKFFYGIDKFVGGEFSVLKQCPPFFVLNKVKIKIIESSI